MSDYWRGVVRWDNEDVICAALDSGICMSIDDAEQWWNRNERRFKLTLGKYGDQLIRDILENEVKESAHGRGITTSGTPPKSLTG